jgi:NADPH2:quinone reductase
LCALTAWQAFFDDANLQSGDTVLIHAGAGGVGSMAIQLAKHRGATVITTASAKNHSYVKELGADHAIDYTAEDFVAKVKEIAPDGVDMVLDCVGNETLERSFEVIRKGGTIRSIVNKPNPEKAKEREVSSGFTFVRPDGDELRKIASLLEAEEIVAPKVNELPLEQAVEAFAKSKTEHTVGKLVLKVSTS